MIVRRILHATVTVILTGTLLTPVTAGAVTDDCAPLVTGGAEGTIDHQEVAPTTGVHRLQVLWVDFPDEMATAPDLFLRTEIDGIEDTYASMSSGRLDLQVAHSDWIRMPSTSSSYDMQRDVGHAEHLRYVQDAVDAATSRIDFTSVDSVMVVPIPSATAIAGSQALVTPKGIGIASDGVDLRFTAVIGADDVHDAQQVETGQVVLHEFAHLLGLPDLYATSGEPRALVSGWGSMGSLRPQSPDLLGWHKYRLGWTTDTDIVCLVAGSAITLAPNRAGRGTRLAVAPGADGVVHVIEYRDGEGLDRNGCSRGVLAYRVNQRGRVGVDLVQVLGRGDVATSDCHGLDRATSQAGERQALPGSSLALEVSRIADGTATIDVVGDTTVARISGTSRVTTAVAASQAQFPDSRTNTAILARADNFADALAGTPLARARRAPILLTDPARLDGHTAEELKRVLEPGGTVLLLGGADALDPLIERQVRGLGFTVRRVSGADRFATATAVADELGDVRGVLLASGRSAADAVTAGAAAAHLGGVVLLTDGVGADRTTTAWLAAHRVPTWAIGGAAALAHPDATPIVGRDRYDTSVRVAGTFFDDPADVGIVNGSAYADAIAGGALLAALDGPLLLSGADVPAVVGDHLCGSNRQVTLIGGESVLPAAIEGTLHAITTRTDC